jgi:hypothetical protein
MGLAELMASMNADFVFGGCCMPAIPLHMQNLHRGRAC